MEIRTSGPYPDSHATHLFFSLFSNTREVLISYFRKIVTNSKNNLARAFQTASNSIPYLQQAQRQRIYF